MKKSKKMRLHFSKLLIIVTIGEYICWGLGRLIMFNEPNGFILSSYLLTYVIFIIADIAFAWIGFELWNYANEEGSENRSRSKRIAIPISHYRTLVMIYNGLGVFTKLFIPGLTYSRYTLFVFFEKLWMINILVDIASDKNWLLFYFEIPIDIYSISSQGIVEVVIK